MMDVLVAGRMAAEARMTSRCTHWRLTGHVMQDESTGRETPQWVALAENLPCRVKGASRDASAWSSVNRQGSVTQEPTRTLSVPLGTEVRNEDWFEVTCGDSAGLALRVLESVGADQQTALRLPVIGDDRPLGWS